MRITELLKERRTYYAINKNIPVAEGDVVRFIESAAELVPDSFNMKSSRVVVLTGAKHDAYWDLVYNVFEGKVPREKIDSFKAGFGTILYFYDMKVVEGMQAQFPTYADRFAHWAAEASAMLQINVWTGLRELNVGASLQHYNPIIDEAVRDFLGLPASYVLDAQMPFGGIAAEPDPKDKEDISLRVKVVR